MTAYKWTKLTSRIVTGACGQRRWNSSVKPPQLSISRRISIAFVYNVIHVGYGRPMCREVTTETPQTRTNKIPGTKQKCKTNVFHMAQCRALPKVTGLCLGLHKHEDSITAESWSLHSTSKTTDRFPHTRALGAPTDWGFSAGASHAIALWPALDSGGTHPPRIKRHRRANRLTGKEANSHVHIKGMERFCVC